MDHTVYCLSSVLRRPSVVALALADLAAEEPIDEHDIAEDDRQERERADQHEALARGRGRGLPDGERGRDEIGKDRDHEAEIAEQEERDRGQEGQRLASLIEPA